MWKVTYSDGSTELFDDMALEGVNNERNCIFDL